MKKMMYFGSMILVFMLLNLCTLPVSGQGVTTASVEGVVLNMTSEPLPNANVVAVHTPSGTRYGAVTRGDGRFNLPNMRTGGPYTITASYVGYETDMANNVYLALGENRSMVFILLDAGTTLEEVIITGKLDRVFNSGRTGAVTNLDNQTINQMPTINRSINDYTRLNPQSNGSSFAGRDNRFNNYTIDGNIYNNNFGLGSGQFAGSNPISMEVIEEIQVNIAPYDVRQGGFTGANVNAITKSGTNEFRGVAYAYFRNEQMQGFKLGEERLSVDDAFTRTRGLSIGGPILKDRLFFFFNYEEEEASTPGDSRKASRPGLAPDGVTVSRVPAETLDFVRAQMKELYDYETGDYEGYAFANQGTRINARLDFNINASNKVAVRFNRFAAFNDVSINGNSLRYLPSNLRYNNTNRYGIEAMTFRNANYSIDNNVTSFVGELNSIFGSRFANNLNVGYTMIEDPIRSIPGGQAFPFIEVLEYENGTPLYFFSMGNELFSVGNLLSNNILNVTNNFSAFLGPHTITAGINFEHQTFDNAFNPTFNSFYRYNSYADFKASVIDKDVSVVPAAFAIGYSFTGSEAYPTDQTAFGQVGVYVQDKWQVNPQLSVSGGLRIDFPFFPIDLPSNPKLDTVRGNIGTTGAPDWVELNFYHPQTDALIKADVGKLPGVKPLISPRLAANFDVLGDNSLQVRFGTGFFSGRIPFVWISNQVNANGVTRGGFGILPNQWGTGNNPEWEGFQADVNYYRPDPSNLEAELGRDINITDENFKFPQVWRTNIGIDYRLPFGTVVTVDAIYSKDYNSPFAVNINLGDPTDTVFAKEGLDPRPIFGRYAKYANFNNVMLLTNVNMGYYSSVTAQIKHDFKDFVSASLAYTRSVSKDYGLIGGSQAASLWPDVVKDNRNQPELGYSRFDSPNRLVGYLSLNTKMLSEKNTTSFSVFYFGGNAGRFSYTYSGNFGDGASRLMYIPVDDSEIKLLDITKVVDGETVVDVSAAEQWDILDAYIKQDHYLSKNRGKVAERNGALLPWNHRFDFRMTQDINFTKNVNRYKMQITFDILNVGNLINSEWGVEQTVYQRNLLNYAGMDSEKIATYRLNRITGTSDFPSESYREIVNINQLWRAQVGLRLVF